MEKPDKTRIHTVYKLKSGERVPSVTTVLGILNKPALLDWAWQMGTQGLDYKAVRDNAGGIGTLAHMMICADLKGEKPDTSEYSQQDIGKAETCLIKYWEWAKGHKVEPIMVETPLISEQYQFGGTIDFFGNVDGRPTLVDFKTGKALYPEFFYQLAGYGQLLAEANQLIEVTRILRIGRNEDEGFEERTIGKLDKQWQVFYNCLNIYKLQRAIRIDKP
ncbi:MAG: hypothetical protein Q8M94_08015 [Ignavibacteria bacterium]|nr:hypothetical protein [Ignavibacteria bacterium]